MLFNSASCGFDTLGIALRHYSYLLLLFSQVFIPWGPNWFSSNILKMLNFKDRRRFFNQGSTKYENHSDLTFLTLFSLSRVILSNLPSERSYHYYLISYHYYLISYHFYTLSYHFYTLSYHFCISSYHLVTSIYYLLFFVYHQFCILSLLFLIFLLLYHFLTR